MPANASAWLSTTVSVPPVVTPAIVPIWLAVPARTAAPAIPEPLVNVPAISVPPAPCIRAPEVVEISAVPLLLTVFCPASTSVPLLTICKPLALKPVRVPMLLVATPSVPPFTALPVRVATVSGPVGSVIDPSVCRFKVPATPVRLTAPSSVMFAAVVVNALPLVTSVYCPIVSVPVLIFPSNVLSTTNCVDPARLMATVVENGAISTMPLVAVTVLDAFSVTLSAITETRPALAAVRVAAEAAPMAMVSPAWAAWKNRLVPVNAPVSVKLGLSTRIRLPLPTWMPLLATI